jgi:TolB-like protein
MAADPERLERFKREAQSVAALNHPNIVTIYSVEEAEGIHFLTMELVDGEALDRLIPNDGLDLGRLLDISIPLTAAISAAHEKGIVHRDLKPANVMVGSDGRVKVLDFGLAKRQPAELPGWEQEDASTFMMTREGVIMGTAPYLSPEQAKGSSLDHRTDIFSLGVMLYELATGARPFGGGTAVELVSAILKDTPQPLSEVKPDLPRDLGRVIGRCLEKSPSDRYQTSRDVLAELEILREGRATAALEPTTGIPEPVKVPLQASRIAVLPLKYRGSDADLEAFADGLIEDITSGLSRFDHLQVVARSSTLRFKDQSIDIRSLGESLGACYLLEGSVRQASGTVRVNVQLVEASTGTQLWVETYDRDLSATSLFSAQDEVADRVVATIADSYGVLVRSLAAELQGKPDHELTASDWMARLFSYRQRFTPAEHAELRESLEQAVKTLGDQAGVWACLSQVYLDEANFGFNTRPDDPLDRALHAAQRAVDIDPTGQLGCQVLAQAYFFRHDLEAFLPAAEKAMALNPRDSNSLGILGLLIAHTGDFDRGARITRRAMDLNPHHAAFYHFGPIWEHFHNRDYEKALVRAKRANMPGFFWPYLVVAATSGYLGRRTEAEAAVKQLLDLDPEFAAQARQKVESWHFASGLLEPLLDGLRKAGLEIPDA